MQIHKAILDDQVRIRTRQAFSQNCWYATACCDLYMSYRCPIYHQVFFTSNMKYILDPSSTKHYLLCCHNNNEVAKDLLIREPQEPDNSTTPLNGLNYLRWGVAHKCKSSGVWIYLNYSSQSLLCSWCHHAALHTSRVRFKHILKYSNKAICIHIFEQI